MSNLREYIITLHNFDDLDEFYKDMETLRPTMYGVMPERAVDCHARRPSSRNTHYFLTDEEAEELKKDQRIWAIELSPHEQDLIAAPTFVQTSAYWDKSISPTNNNFRNWGLYRCTLDNTVANWGADNVASTAGTAITTSEGQDVDVVIIDGHFNPAHPEFALNSDGTGGSRVQQYNWFSLRSQVLGLSNGFYVYTPYVDTNNVQATSDNDHGCHVAGIACGNTQGWARKANIYNISPYGTNPNFSGLWNGSNVTVFDWVRAFHQNKPINSKTGRPNPTITNNSWGYYGKVYLSDITTNQYRGVTNNPPYALSDPFFWNLGVFGPDATGYYVLFPTRIPSIEAEIADCIAAGILMVGAAGNYYNSGARDSSDPDWNNFITLNKTVNGVTSSITQFYNRGSSPGVSCICVGNANSNTVEGKVDSSNCGPVVDIFAPGASIMSSINSTPAVTDGTYDYRNSSYYISKKTGTSMASPQVTGVLACLLEIYPNMNQSEALAYLRYYGKSNKLTARNTWPITFDDLQGANNLYLKYVRERPLDGLVYPKVNMRTRPTSGQVFPRQRINRYAR